MTTGVVGTVSVKTGMVPGVSMMGIIGVLVVVMITKVGVDEIVVDCVEIITIGVVGTVFVTTGVVPGV